MQFLISYSTYPAVGLPVLLVMTAMVATHILARVIFIDVVR